MLVQFCHQKNVHFSFYRGTNHINGSDHQGIFSQFPTSGVFPKLIQNPSNWLMK